MEKNPPYDYILLGSSRTLNFLQPKRIDSLTGLQGINLAIDASGPLELKLMLKEYLKKGTPSYVFVQTDYRTEETPDPLGSIPWMPYIIEQDIFNAFKPYGKYYSYYHYIPYYRYAKFGPKIGSREILLTQLGDKNQTYEYLGYQPVYTVMQKEGKAAAELNKLPNAHLLEIVEICQELNIKLYFFTSPIYQSTFDFSFYKDFLPNYSDFSNLYQNKTLFMNVTHLNDEGASIFSEYFATYYFKN